MSIPIDLESSMKELVSEFIVKETNNLSELNQILIKVKNEKSEFDNLLKSLEIFFNNSNDILRKNSLRLICLVLERVKNLKFEEEKIKNLLEFSFGKMKDVVCAPFAVKMLYCLLVDQCTNISFSLTKFLIRSLIENFKMENFHIPSYYQETRFYSLKILNHMIEKFHTNDIMIDKMIIYIQNVLDGIEGEKDPRNILIMFNLVKNVNKHLGKNLLKIYAKNFFETLEVYYPIEFTPPKNSPDKITREDLVDLLNETFASNEYYLEYLIEEIRDKISSTQVDIKIQVLKTIRKLNEELSPQILHPHFITLLNLILHQILNNEDEILHMESIITFKEMIKRFCESFTEDSMEELEKHILANINKIFEKSEDLLFSSENPKNTFDAKDLIIVLIEFATYKSLNFKERSLKICLKLINSYTENGKLFFLKNANSILFFTLKKLNSDHISPLDEYVNCNKIFIKNVLLNLLKKSSNLSQSPEETESIIDILTCFIVKTDSIFSEDEVSELFNKILNTWRECDSNIENHLGICLNEIIVKYEKLNNLKFLLNMLDIKLKDCMRNEKIEISDIFKFLHLLQNYSTNNAMTKDVITFLFNTYYSLFSFETECQSSNSQKQISELESIINKLTHILLNIFDTQEIFNTQKDLIKNFLEKFTNLSESINGKLIQINLNIFKDTCLLFKNFIVKLDIDYTDKLMNLFIFYTETFLKKAIDGLKLNLNVLSETRSSQLHLFLKIIQFILRKRILNSKGGEMIHNEDFYDSFFSFSLNLLTTFEKILNSENNSHFKSLKYLFKRISKNIGLALYDLSNRSEGKVSDIALKFLSPYFDSLLSNLTLSMDTDAYIKVNLDKNLTITTSLLNCMILYNDKNIPELIKRFSSTIENITNPRVCEVLEFSNLFRFDKKLFQIANKDTIFNLLSELKNIYQYFQTNNKITQSKTIISFLLNIYSRFEENFLQDNYSDTVLNLCIKALESEINLKISCSLMRQLFKDIYSDFVRKKGYDMRKLIENILKIISKTDDMNIKIDLLCCLYRLKFVISNWEEKIVKLVLKKLKPILNDKKRLVRKYCGMCINIWSMSE